MNGKNRTETDIVLIGTGIMSATLGTLLKILDPRLSIAIFERMDSAATESSDAWNNAGTGHSAFCELNYTPQDAEGNIHIGKAVKIAESFEISRQFWTHLIRKNYIDDPEKFISRIPHMSFVWGKENVEFLRKRYDTLQGSALFRGMHYSEDNDQLKAWMPLIMEGRDENEIHAATRMDIGTDVNFGALTRCMFKFLKGRDDVKLNFNHEVRNLRKNSRGKWRITIKDNNTGKRKIVYSRFVFIGAGGGTLPLLLKSGIPEGKGYGGFPVSGQWLRCKDEQITRQHHAKVYGLAEVDSPPMSVPHLDSRIIRGKKELLFGPFAGFTTKFLKNGSWFDLIFSVRLSNIWPMISAGARNIPLTKYLISQVSQSPEDRLEELRKYVPNARLDQWELEIAGQRVQVIKKDDQEGGVLEFGTEVVHSADGSLAALLGASPGASTAVSIMLDLMKKCFFKEFSSPAWQKKLQEIIPSFGQSLANDEELLNRIRQYTSEVLDLNETFIVHDDVNQL